jgi:peptidoglycan/LPS O-acetylase OafA/YrhL
MMQRFLGFNDIVGAYWTLQVEIIFYVLVEIILASGLMTSVRLYPLLSIVFALLAILTAFGRYYLDRKLPVAAFTGLSIMFASTTYFMHVRSSYLSKAAILTFATTIYVMLGTAFLLGYRKDWGYAETPHRFFAMYLAAAVIFILFSANGLSNVILNFLGKISYRVYLVHVPMIALVGVTNVAGDYALSLTLILAISVLLHYFVEKPFVKLGRECVDRLRQRARPSTKCRNNTT